MQRGLIPRLGGPPNLRCLLTTSAAKALAPRLQGTQRPPPPMHPVRCRAPVRYGDQKRKTYITGQDTFLYTCSPAPYPTRLVLRSHLGRVDLSRARTVSKGGGSPCRHIAPADHHTFKYLHLDRKHKARKSPSTKVLFGNEERRWRAASTFYSLFRAAKKFG